VHPEIHGSGTVVVRHEKNLGLRLVEQLFGVVRSYDGVQTKGELIALHTFI